MPRNNPMMMPGFPMMMPGFPMMNQPGFAQLPGHTPMISPMQPWNASPSNPYAGLGFSPYTAAFNNPYRNTAASASSSPYSYGSGGSGSGGYGSGGSGSGGYGSGGSGSGGSGSPAGSAGSSPYDYGTSAANSVASASMQGVSAAQFGYLDLLGLPHDGINMRWPLGLRILAPAPKATALRQQVDSLLHLAAAEAASGSTKPGTVSAATLAIGELRDLLHKGGSAALAEQTSRDARQFLNRLDQALLSLAK
jgi:hypothetical protein